MIRVLIFGFFLTLHLFPSAAQQLPEQWIRRFQAQGKASDRISAITTDASGNVYVAGYSGNHHGAPDAFAMKRNPQGDTLWVYYYDAGGNNEDFATDITVDNIGNTYITGHSQGSASAFFDCFTVKLLPSGTEDWSARYSPGNNTESYGTALVADALGNIYVAGYTDPFPGSNDWLVLKYNSSGIEQWVDVLNGPDNGEDAAMDIVIAPNGNPTVCGYTYSLNASGSINAFVKQYTPSNGTVWTDTWTNPVFTGVDKAYGLGYSAGGDLLVGGETTNSSGFNYDAFALKYNSAGIRQWEFIYTDSNTVADEYLRRVCVDDSGNVYFTGTDYQDAYVTRINNSGLSGWRKEWRGPLSNGSDVFHGIAADNQGNVYATGRGVYPGEDYYGNGGMPNMIIAKYNSNGDSLWTYRCGDTLNSSMGFAITSFNGNVYAGGFVTDTAYINENLYTLITDSAGNSVSEWIFNGQGDAITMGQFVETDGNDNVYCAATIDRLYNEGYDVALIKYDPAGNLLWEKYYSSYGWNNDTITAMQFDPAGNLVLTISTDSAHLGNNFKITLLKVNQQGDFIDTVTYSDPSSASIHSGVMEIRSDGSIILAASSNINGGMLLYFDSSLNFIWTAKIDSVPAILTRVNSIDLFPNGDIAVGGHSQTVAGSVGIVQRYDAAGTKLWSTAIDSNGVYDEVRDVTVNGTGDIAYTGASGSVVAYTTIVGKLNGATGSQVWRQVYNPNTNNEHGVKVRFSPAGNIVFISRGWTGSVARYYTAQYSDAGIFQWAKVYSQTASDREPVDLIVEPDNRVVTAGWAVNGFTTNYDYVLAGYSSTGDVEFINTYSDTILVSASWDQLNDLTRDGQGSFVVTGRSSQEFFNNFLYKMLTIKFGGVVVGLEEMGFERNQMAYVYPNPSIDGVFTLINVSPELVRSGRVFDLQGRLINTLDSPCETVELSESPAGLYILMLERDGFPAEYLRLIKN